MDLEYGRSVPSAKLAATFDTEISFLPTNYTMFKKCLSPLHGQKVNVTYNGGPPYMERKGR